MTEIPRKHIDNYTKSLNKLSADVQGRIADDLAKIDFSSDVATIRDAVIDRMEFYCGPYTDMAAILAAEFYDGLRERAVGEKMGALAESGREPIATERAVRGIMQDVVEGKAAEVVIGKLVGRADYEIKRAAGECIYRNGKRDPLRPRFARVPSGGETCRFCIMLASRGFVYRSEKTAGEDGHYHANCDCRIVPGFDGETSIDGYDPENLYRQWRESADRTSTVRYLEDAERAGDIKYEKPLSAFIGTADEKDLAAHVALHNAGYRFSVLKEDAPDRYSNIDLMIDGEKWEVKSPNGENIRTVESNVRKARRQFLKNYPKPLPYANIVFNATDLAFDDDKIAEELLKRMNQHGVDKALLVTRSGDVREINKAQRP